MPQKLLLTCALLAAGATALLSAADTRCWDKYVCKDFTMKNPNNHGAFDGNYLCAAQYVTPIRGRQPVVLKFVNMVDPGETGQIYPSSPLGTPDKKTANARKCGGVQFRINATADWQIPMVTNPYYLDPVTGLPAYNEKPMIPLPCGYHFIDNDCVGYTP
jgi:hypothetical protein